MTISEWLDSKEIESKDVSHIVLPDGWPMIKVQTKLYFTRRLGNAVSSALTTIPFQLSSN